jgi:hypothetical protein
MQKIATAAEEGVEEGIGELAHIEDGDETGARDLPEVGLGKEFAPEGLPSRDGPGVGPAVVSQVVEASWRGSLQHGARQDDDRGKEEPATDEADGWGRDAFAATVAIAAEAKRH